MKKQDDGWGLWMLRCVLGIFLLLTVVQTNSTRIYSRRPLQGGSGLTHASGRPDARASFIAVGDIMLSRGVDRMIEKSRDPFSPYRPMEDLFESSDFNFGNLESPISGDDRREGKGLVFNAKKNRIEGLIRYRFQVLSLANNHALDQGLAGLRHTRDHLVSNKIRPVGAGLSKEQAWEPAIFTANGLTIGFIAASYSSNNDNGSTVNPYVARIEQIYELRAAIASLRSKTDIVVVSMHAGVEYTRRPVKPQVYFARAAIDAGADVVIGGHPHWIQTVEKYNGKYIFYSLGNFIFDQKQPGTTEGLALRVNVTGSSDTTSGVYRTRIESIELLPVIIEDLGVPRLALKEEADLILSKIGLSNSILRP